MAVPKAAKGEGSTDSYSVEKIMQPVCYYWLAVRGSGRVDVMIPLNGDRRYLVTGGPAIPQDLREARL